MCVYACVCVCVCGDRERLEKTLKSPMDFKEVKPVSPKANNPEYEGLNLKLKTESEISIFWQPEKKSQFIGKDPDDEKY